MLEITSQRGTAGKMVYNYSFSGGVTLRGRRGVDMMNSKEKLELERRLENTATPGYRYSEDYYRKYHANDPNLESLIARGQHRTGRVPAGGRAAEYGLVQRVVA